MLLSLRGILLQPSGSSEQVFLPRSHLRILPGPITTLGFCARKGRSVLAGLGKAHGRWTGEQGGLSRPRGLAGSVAEPGLWAARACRQLLAGNVLRNRDLWSPLWAGSHCGEQRSRVGNLVVADPQLDASHRLPPCCVPEVWVHRDRPVQCSLGVGTARPVLGPPVEAMQAYWEGSADLLVGRAREESLGEGEDAAWSRSACVGRRLENQGPFTSAKTRFLASRSMAKAD